MQKAEPFICDGALQGWQSKITTRRMLSCKAERIASECRQGSALSLPNYSDRLDISLTAQEIDC